MQECREEIINFMLLFNVLFIGFALSGWHLFGHQLDSYSSFGQSFITNFNFVLGDFDWVSYGFVVILDSQ